LYDPELARGRNEDARRVPLGKWGRKKSDTKEFGRKIDEL